jgi:hypothetical protein
MRLFQQGTSLLLACCLLLGGQRDVFAWQADASVSEPPQAAIQSPEQLQQLVAPIALYPDALIAQILSAATYPDQIVEAEKWMEQHKGLTGADLGKEVDKQPWDPSVKALTQFPAVLSNMSRNLAWTSELGDVHVNQQQNLTEAIQTMRQRAKQAGNLKSTPQEKVSDKGQDIYIDPAGADEVYVPEYDPWLVYGAPLAVFPGWYPYPGLYLNGPGLAFGFGFGVGLFAGFGWGWHGWGYDWHGGGRVVYNHNTYISHSRTIINHNNFNSTRNSFNHSSNFHGGGASHGFSGGHSSAFSGFSHGGMASGSAMRGQSSFGGSHGGGGGFHGGGGGGHR